MPTFLQRLFLSPEVKIVLSAYRDEVRKIGSENGGGIVGSVAGIELLHEEVKHTIHAGRNTLKQKIAAGEAPRVLALLVISNLAYRNVASGRFHTYCGMLSLQGKSLHILWHYTVNELEKLENLPMETGAVLRQISAKRSRKLVEPTPCRTFERERDANLPRGIMRRIVRTGRNADDLHESRVDPQLRG